MFSTTFLIGRIGGEPENKTTTTGKKLSCFSIVTTGKWIDRSGESQEKATWHRISAWEQLAELSQSYLTKGRLVFIEGEIVNNSWEDREGKKHYSSEVRARRILFLDSSSKENC